MDLTNAVWRKSTRSNATGACVEVAQVAGQVAVRDSKDRQGPVLLFNRDTFTALLDALKSS